MDLAALVRTFKEESGDFDLEGLARRVERIW